MSGGADMSVPDMTAEGTPGVGQIVLADVVGTVFTPSATTPALPRTHALLALASMPVVVPTSDPSSNLVLAPPAGCTINRYTASNIPPMDGDAGTITISGWNQSTVGTSAVTSTSALGSSMYPIECTRGGQLNRYTCGFSGTANADGGGMGMTTGSVVFPLVPHQLIDDSTERSATFWPANPIGRRSYPDCSIPRPCGQQACPAPAGALTCDVICCEQSPVLVGNSNITEAIGGGNDYMAASKMLGDNPNADAGANESPQPVYLVSVTQGGGPSIAGMDSITLGPSLSMADGAIDKTKDLTLNFSCDGSATIGGGCAGQGDLAALLITTSTNSKATFALPSPESGSAECITGLSSGTIHIAANQLTALVGSQSTGSFEIALARLHLLAASNGAHTVAYTAGMGVFGFTNQ